MKLPHYGKYNGFYGYFTSEGFVYYQPDTNDVDIEHIEYSDFIEFETEKELDSYYNVLGNFIW